MQRNERCAALLPWKENIRIMHMHHNAYIIQAIDTKTSLVQTKSSFITAKNDLMIFSSKTTHIQCNKYSEIRKHYASRIKLEKKITQIMPAKLINKCTCTIIMAEL